MPDAPRAIEELLKEIGLDPTSVGPELVRRAVRERMRYRKVSDLTEYEREVKNSAQERQELIEEIVVGESWFFRDERPFEWLRGYVRERLTSAMALLSRLQILSIPCAAGEEPYSIAILLAEEGFSAERYQIDAIDLSARRLAIARRGVYSKNAFRKPMGPSQGRYIRKHAEGYEIDPAVRKSVHFIHGNILDERLFENSQRYDVIFCRNLLIYLNPAARGALLASLDRLLASDGVLVLGHADRLESPGASAAFETMGDPGCFAYRRVVGRAASSYTAGVDTDPSGSIPTTISPYPVHTNAEVDLPAKAAADSTSTVSTGSDELVARKNDPSILLGQASELANRGQFRQAISHCQQHLKESGPAATTYCLMGMIYQASGDGERAEDSFRRAVYLDPNHDEALLALALLAERRGDERAAAGFRRRAERTATLNGKRVN